MQRHIWPTKLCVAAILLAGCSTQMAQRIAPPQPVTQSPSRAGLSAHDLALINRLSWGVSPALAKTAQEGVRAFIQHQLHPSADDGMPPEISSQIAALSVSTVPIGQLAEEISNQRRQMNMISDPEQKQTAQRALQDRLNQLAREASTRSLLRDIYSANQLKELTTWFWLRPGARWRFGPITAW